MDEYTIDEDVSQMTVLFACDKPNCEHIGEIS